MGLSVLRNLRPEGVPSGLTPWKVAKILDGHTGGKLGFAEKNRYPWRVLFIGGMWFQDLFNYDFRRTEMCIIPYACLLYTSDAADERSSVDLGGRRIIKKKNINNAILIHYSSDSFEAEDTLYYPKQKVLC